MKFTLLLGIVALSSLCDIYADSKNITRNFHYAYSPIDLQTLNILEKKLFHIVKEYVAKTDNEPELVFKRYIADYEDSSLLAFNDWETTLSKKHFIVHTNPIWTYRMIWRFVTDLHKIRNILFSAGDAETLTRFQKTVSSSFVWPRVKDLQDSMDNLINFHHVYGLNLEEFSNGIVGSVVTKANLAAIHCFELSEFCMNNDKFTLAIIWLRLAKKKQINVSGHPILDKIEETVISKLFEDIMDKYDRVRGKNTLSRPNLVKYFNNMDTEYTYPKKQITRGEGLMGLDPSPDDIRAFSSLCNGGNLQPEKEKSKLYCWYESKINPAWYINPQKMELHSKDPYIIQVYNFVGPELIKYLKREALPTMGRSFVITKDKTENEEQGFEKKYFQGRTSMTSWLFENFREQKLTWLRRKIDFLTGLTSSWDKTNAREGLQIAIYATGGYSSLHLDPVRIGGAMERLATFMFYLNNVELGGNTVFTSVGVAVPPVEGSAVFWYNLKYNGEADYRVWHGGCPVLLGEKWVANNWIRNNDNMFSRKCPLHEDH